MTNATTSSTHGRILPLLVGGAAALAAPACRTTAPELVDASGTPWADVAPAPFRIGIAPVELPPSHRAPGEEEMGLAIASPAELQEALVAALTDVHATSEVVAFEVMPDLARLADERLDLLVRPRLADAQFEYVGTSGGAALSALLWITTWFGGFLVEDGEYRAAIDMELAFLDPRLADPLSDPVSLQTTTTGLQFFDRNEAFNGGFWLSFVVPPFWTTDDERITSESLTQRGLLQLATLFKRHLHTEALASVEPARYAQIGISSPVNGSLVGATTDVACSITTKQGATGVSVYLNGEYVREDRCASVTEVPELAAQRTGSRYRLEFEMKRLRLVPGRNEIQIVVDLAADQIASRTIVVTRD